MEDGFDLDFGTGFGDLYCREGLTRLDGCFTVFLATRNPQLCDRLMTARSDGERLSTTAESDLIVELAPEIEDFLARLFRIETEVRDVQIRNNALAPLYSVKRQFVQRR